MQLRIVRLTIPEFLVTIAHLPLGSFLPVRRAEGNSLAKSIPVALCTSGAKYRLRPARPPLSRKGTRHSGGYSRLAARAYFKRYSDDAIDLCDVLSSFSSQAKVVTALCIDLPDRLQIVKMQLFPRMRLSMGRAARRFCSKLRFVDDAGSTICRSQRFFTQMSFVYFFPLGGLTAAKASGKDSYAAAPHCSLVASTN